MFVYNVVIFFFFFYQTKKTVALTLIYRMLQFQQITPPSTLHFSLFESKFTAIAVMDTSKTENGLPDQRLHPNQGIDIDKNLKLFSKYYIVLIYYLVYLIWILGTINVETITYQYYKIYYHFRIPYFVQLIGLSTFVDFAGGVPLDIPKLHGLLF